MSTQIQEFRADLAQLFEYYSQYRSYGKELIRTLDRYVIPEQENLIQRMNQFIRKKNLTDEEFQNVVPLLRAANQVHNNTQRIREEYILHHPEEFGISTVELRRIKETFERIFGELDDIEDEELYFSAAEKVEDFIRQHLLILRDIPDTHPNRNAVERMIVDMEYALDGLTYLAPIRTSTNPTWG